MVECIGLLLIAAILVYILLSDTGNRNVSIKANKIKNEKIEKDDK